MCESSVTKIILTYYITFLTLWQVICKQFRKTLAKKRKIG